MEMKIRLPEPVAEAVLQLPDPDAFVRRAVTEALAVQQRRTSRQNRSHSDEAAHDTAPPLNGRKREDVWRRANRDYLQRYFSGQWVVLEGEEIVASSKNAAEAVGEARTKGVAVPFVFFVEPPRPPGVVRIGL